MQATIQEVFQQLVDIKTKNILATIIAAKGRPYFVGGCVRDLMLNKIPKDFDVEVFNISKKKLIQILKTFGEVDEYGKAFGIIVTNNIEFAIPRTEKKTGEKHTSFEIKLNPRLSLKNASKRRDFTINSIYYDWKNQRLIDPNNGLEHLKLGIITHTSEQFSEDVLRVLRAVRFACRFDFDISLDTKELIKKLVPKLKNLQSERIWGELIKIITYKNIPKFFKLLKDLTILDFLPEMKNLIGCPQQKEWHPEGDVYQHTMHVLSACQDLLSNYDFDKDETIIVLLGALCHDFGKPNTTKVINSKITAHGHDIAGIEPTKRFLERIGCPKSYISKVCALVEMHMIHVNFINHDVSLKFARNLKNKLAKFDITFYMLECIVHSDMNGRPPLKGGLPQSWLKIKNVYETIKDEPVMLSGKIAPIITGDFLMKNYGFKQGKELGAKLAEIYEMQLNGDFKTIEEYEKLFVF
jgi:tRNA nucleotidyltransferase (CCA-adding enzyme)